ncbi:tryptophan 2,3-dioxygenase family protein [Mycolicibacterium boenickei]
MKNMRLSHEDAAHPPLETLDCGHGAAGEDPNNHYCNIINFQHFARVPLTTARCDADEPLFIGVHQMHELVFAQSAMDCQKLITALDEDGLALAISSGRRWAQLATTLTSITQLLGTITPAAFALLRNTFGRTSGADSIQFPAGEVLAGLRDTSYRTSLEVELGDDEHGRLVRRTEALEALQQSRSVDDAARDLATRHGASPLALLNPQFGESTQEVALRELCEALRDFDEAFELWSTSHARFVEGAIGPHARGSGYSVGLRYLDVSTRRRFLASFWNARSDCMGAVSNVRGTDQRDGAHNGCGRGVAARVRRSPSRKSVTQCRKQKS